MFIYHSEANLDFQILFGKITHLVDPDIGVGVLVNVLYGNANFAFRSGP